MYAKGGWSQAGRGFAGRWFVAVAASPCGSRTWSWTGRRAARESTRAVNLTSRPDRAAANRLYQRLGFAPRETNVYRLELR